MGPPCLRRVTSNPHELAISVMFETGVQYWGDHPITYRSIPAAMSFLKIVPSSWDDTKFIDGFPGLTLHHDGTNRDTIVNETKTVTNQTVLTVPTLEGGGFVGQITPKLKP